MRFRTFGGIDGDPPILVEVHLPATVLGLRHILRRGAETLESQLGLGDPDAVHVGRREACRAGKTNVERVEIGALAAQVAGLEHEADVTETTRSEERRVGKECRSRWWRDEYNKKKKK